MSLIYLSFCWKTKFHQVKLKIEWALLSHLWILQYPIWELEGHEEEFYKMQGFYRKKGGARLLLPKEKKCYFKFWQSQGAEGSPLRGGRERERFPSGWWPLLSMGAGERPRDILPGWCLTRKVQTHTFQGEIETAIRSGFKARLVA